MTEETKNDALNRTKVFPRLKKGIFPNTVPLKKMIGPSIVLVAASTGSDEFVLWPFLTVNHGYTIWWACMLGNSRQLLTPEILVSRYSNYLVLTCLQSLCP